MLGGRECNSNSNQSHCWLLTQIQVTDVKALLRGQVTQQRAGVGVSGRAQRVATELEDFLSSRVTQ